MTDLDDSLGASKSSTMFFILVRHCLSCFVSRWNPFREEQAIDRAHRIGQERDVIVDKLIIKGTVEDRILSLQHAKRAMVEQALGNKFAKSTDCRCVCATLF